ncbi:PREDICTED: MLO-like protein 4 [Camelina sativa]|uniref:MLO-like protein n=1 Tax=Camelina sativa TaxID=90675 RepID=A0ABM0XX17_CAMSA|nr:PREDICTED: MLO-like protein 4 [Camelina sativa]
MEHMMKEGRSLAETPTYSVASVVTVLIFVCFLVERAIYRFGKWLKKTRRKALFTSLEKMKEELMLLGLISLLLSQSARWISEICVNSSLFNSKFYICSEEDYGIHKKVLLEHTPSTKNTSLPHHGIHEASHQCGHGREPFVSYEGLEQLLRFLFVLGITHVLYSGIAIGLAMSKIYSWRKWETQAIIMAESDIRAKKTKVMKRQSTFVFHHASHPWSNNRFLIWMLCFLRQFRGSIRKSDYFALRLGFLTKHNLPFTYNFHTYMVRTMEYEFHGIVGISWPLWVYAIVCICINVHGLNMYFWLSFIPAILVMLVGTKLEHVVSKLALEVKEQQTGTTNGAQVKPRDGLFWFGKPEILLRLIQFIIFQNAFEMATFIWFLWGIKERSCFMKNHVMISSRLISGVLVQFWCSYGTVPLNVIVTQMGSRHKKAVIAESVRDSLHSWCKRVKERSKHTRSVCSLDTATIDERDEMTVGTLSRSSSMTSLNQITINSVDQAESIFGAAASSSSPQEEYTSRVEEYLSETFNNIGSMPPLNDEIEIEIEGEEDNGNRRSGSDENGDAGETLLELFRRT